MKSVDHARELVSKAEHDWKAAEIGLKHGAPLDTVCFHLQQTVEKLLKSVPACRDIEYPLTHDLDELLNVAAKECPALAPFRDALKGFAAYAVGMRYISSLYPSPEEAQAAFQTTKKIREVVHAWLPPEALP
jgi:HEPN domain-containing protein